MEVRASLLFPALFYIVWRFGLASVAAGLVVSLLCIRLKTSLGDPSAVDARDLTGTLLLTGRYLVFFLMGIACALRLDDLSAIYGKLTPAMHAIACGDSRSRPCWPCREGRPAARPTSSMAAARSM